MFLVRNDAPELADQAEAVRWMDGKVVSTPQGSCTDRIAQATFKQEGVEPKEYLNQPLDVIASGFDSGKIDAAIVWEPTASRLVNAGLARRVASGSLLGALDAGFLVMSQQLLEDRPDVAEGWLKAELEAQRFLADPANADEIAAMAKRNTQGLSEQDLWDALYKPWPEDQGGSPDGVRIRLPFVIPSAARTHITDAANFLSDIDAIGSAELPPDAVDDSLAAKVLGSQEAPGQIEAAAMRGSSTPTCTSGPTCTTCCRTSIPSGTGTSPTTAGSPTASCPTASRRPAASIVPTPSRAACAPAARTSGCCASSCWTSTTSSRRSSPAG